MKKLITLLFVLFTILSYAQNVEIKGNAPDYKGQELILYKYHDYITKEASIIDRSIVDTNGDYSFKYTCKKIEKIFIDADFFKLSVYVYPNQKINIIIPKYKAVTKGDIFFKQVELPVLVDTNNPKELNTLILSFDQKLSALNNKYYHDIINRNKSVIKTIQSKIDSTYTSTNSYFNLYKKYALGICEYPIYTNDIKTFIQKYFSNNMQKNNAYHELFEKIFTNLLTYNQYKKEPNFNHFKLLEEQKIIIREYGITNQILSQYILLKSLHDGAFKPILKKEIYINAIEEIRDKAKSPHIKGIAIKVLEKVKYLSKGYPCPIINGKTQNGKKIKTSDYKGKYLYIMFFERYSRMIKDEINTISRIADSKEYLHIMLICDENNKAKNTKLLKRYKLDDNAIYCKDFSELKKKFRVIVSPSYFLIDKIGNIIQSHTIRPNNKLYKTLNNIHIKELKAGNIKQRKFFN